jgi:D-alanine-D-alanine ligase
MAKINLAVIFGGRTVEHDVSIVTALQFMDNASKEKYDLIPLYISRDGKWYFGEKLRDIEFYEKFDAAKVIQVYLEPTDGSRAVYPVNQPKGLFAGGRKALAEIDAVVPSIHGMNGEDGTLQGLLELMNIPYASPGVLGSALGMDKIAMKTAFSGAGLPLLPYASLERSRFGTQREAALEEIEKALSYPVYVKPSNLGSSIGISRADDRAGLVNALEVAFSYDRRAVIERGVSDLQEINCSAMGFEGDVKASFCEQPVSWKEFLTFEEKYLRGGKSAKGSGAKGGGMENMQRLIPAPIGDEMTKRIQTLTIEAFRLLDCRGVVRVDFIIDKADGKLYINEINTVPGSFAFYLWEPAGVPYPKLIDTIVDKAFAAHKEKNKNNYAFDSSLLGKFKKGGAKGAK